MTNEELAKCLIYMCHCNYVGCADCSMPEMSDGRRYCAAPQMLYRLAANRLREEK